MKRILHLSVILAVMLTSVSLKVQAETFNRSIMAMHKSTGGNFISWRMLPTDPKNATYDLYAGDNVVKTGLTATCYTHSSGTVATKYKVVVKDGDGNVIDTSAEAQTWSDIYKTMTLDRPEGGSFSYTKGQLGKDKPTTDSIGYYSYYPLEASVADADGDGEWEIVVKWEPTARKDNSEDGFTGSCIIDSYHLNPYTGNETPQRMWRIDLGPNIRCGSHYTQFMYYDFNGDGHAELICKTAPGSKDGQGNYVSQAADDETIRATDDTKDWRTTKGRIMDGPEFLTVFDGITGRAIHTIWYNPNRAFLTGRASRYSEAWGDDYGNRGERFLACVAHLEGQDKPASAVMCRGYYTRAYLWAVDFDGEKLSTKWLHASLTKTRVEVTDSNGKKTAKTYSSNTSGKGDVYTAYGQGCHSVAAGDVDGDGCDEIMYGGAAIDHDGSLLYTTGLGHGDAHHLGDFLPDRPGLEFFMPHEDGNNGWHLRDAATGELLVWKPMNGDIGAGLCGDIDLDYRGAEFWVADTENNVFDTEGNVISTSRPNYRFRIYWDGTLQDNVTDKTRITAYNKGKNNIVLDAQGVIKNGSKEPPVLQADLFGDWREEIIYCSSSDSATLRIYSSTYPTVYSVPTLMSDHLYRLSIAWQNVAYNQPPHLSYYLPDRFATRFNIVGTGQKEQTINLGESIEPIVCELENCTSAMVIATLLDGQKVKNFGVPDGFKFTMDKTAGQFTLTATPQQSGTYEVIVRSSGDITGTKLEDTLRIVVNDVTGIVNYPQNDTETDGQYQIFDLQGRQVNPANAKKGIYIINKKKTIIY